MIANKFFVMYNIFGLGIAIAFCIVAYYHWQYNAEFDKHHSNREYIYKVTVIKDVNGVDRPYGISPISLESALNNSVSGIEHIVRYTSESLPIRYKENIFSKQLAYADENVFDVFDFEILNGNENFILDKSSVIISEELATILFNIADPIGQQISIYHQEGEVNYQVAGVFKAPPLNSSLQFDVLTNMSNYIDHNDINEHDWSSFVDATFLFIKDPKSAAVVETYLNTYVEVQNDARKDWLIKSYFIEHLKDISSTCMQTFSYNLAYGMDKAGAISPVILAVMILLLACLNFMNTTLAISSRRLKPIGINKVLGGLRIHSAIQFLSENVVLCFIAFFFAITIAPFLLDGWNSLWPGLEFKMSLMSDLKIWTFFIGLLIITAFLGGFYPAVYISSFNPVKILKGSVKYKGGGWISKIMLAFQFLLATLSIISAVIFIQNGNYLDKMDLGYDHDNIITIPVQNSSDLKVLRNELEQVPMINKVSATKHHMGVNRYSEVLEYQENSYEFKGYDVDAGYLSAVGLDLLEGRSFEQNLLESERGKAIIVNKKLVEDLGFKNPLGKRLKLNDSTQYHIVGVVNDFYPFAAAFEIAPSFLRLSDEIEMDRVVINVDAQNAVVVDKQAREIWERVIPNAPYFSVYDKDRLDQYKQGNKNIIIIFLFLGLVSLILSLVGLYTLVSLSIIKRTKEIGIRKVLGGETITLIRLLNKEYFYIVLIGSAIGSFTGAYFTHMLLDQIFKYSIDFNIISVIISTVLMLIISMLTVSKKVYDAANLNPVDSIKYE